MTPVKATSDGKVVGPQGRKMGRAVFHMLKNDKVFNVEKFLKGKIDFKQIKHSGRCRKSESLTVTQKDSSYQLQTNET